MFCSYKQLDLSKLTIFADFNYFLLVFVDLVQFLSSHANDCITGFPKQIEDVRVCEVAYLHREVVGWNCVIICLIASFTPKLVVLVSNFFLAAGTCEIEQRLRIAFISTEYHTNETLYHKESGLFSLSEHWI